MRLSFRPPYDWEHACAFLAARAIPAIERVDGRGYTRTVATGGVIRVTADDDALRVVWASGLPSSEEVGRRPTLHANVQRMFDLDADPASIAKVLGRDPLLAPLVKQRPGLRIVGAWDAFECTIRAIVGQQISVAAARTMMTRLVTRFGQPVDQDGFTRVFPTPDALADADFESIGLTRARAETLRALARSEESPKGIGPWTRSYVALRALGDRDAFPAGDLILRRMAGVSTARELEARAEAWRPFRGYAVFHLWRAVSAGAQRSRRG